LRAPPPPSGPAPAPPPPPWPKNFGLITIAVTTQKPSRRKPSRGPQPTKTALLDAPPRGVWAFPVNGALPAVFGGTSNGLVLAGDVALTGARTGALAADAVAAGTTRGMPHLGHFVFRPAKSSFTLKHFAHPGHLNSITVGSLESSRTI